MAKRKRRNSATDLSVFEEQPWAQLTDREAQLRRHVEALARTPDDNKDGSTKEVKLPMLVHTLDVEGYKSYCHLLLQQLDRQQLALEALHQDNTRLREKYEPGKAFGDSCLPGSLAELKVKHAARRAPLPLPLDASPRVEGAHDRPGATVQPSSTYSEVAPVVSPRRHTKEEQEERLTTPTPLPPWQRASATDELTDAPASKAGKEGAPLTTSFSSASLQRLLSSADRPWDKEDDTSWDKSVLSLEDVLGGFGLLSSPMLLPSPMLQQSPFAKALRLESPSSSIATHKVSPTRADHEPSYEPTGSSGSDGCDHHLLPELLLPAAGEGAASAASNNSGSMLRGLPVCGLPALATTHVSAHVSAPGSLASFRRTSTPGASSWVDEALV